MLGENICKFVRWCGVTALVTLVGCASAQNHVDNFAPPAPTLKEFTVCQGYGCRIQKTIRIEPFAWAEGLQGYSNLPRSVMLLRKEPA